MIFSDLELLLQCVAVCTDAFRSIILISSFMALWILQSGGQASLYLRRPAKRRFLFCTRTPQRVWFRRRAVAIGPAEQSKMGLGEWKLLTFFLGFTDICSLCQDDIEDHSVVWVHRGFFLFLNVLEEKCAKATCGHAFHRDCLEELRAQMESKNQKMWQEIFGLKDLPTSKDLRYLEQAPQLPSGGVGCSNLGIGGLWPAELFEL